MSQISAHHRSQIDRLRVLKAVVRDKDTQDGIGLVLVLLFLFVVVPLLACRYTSSHNDYLPEPPASVLTSPLEVAR